MSEKKATLFDFANTYAKLPDRFFVRVKPSPVSRPKLIKLNVTLAEHLGLDPAALADADGVEILAGNRIAESSEPLAQAYAGHQFGHFVPQLGDGRAKLLGEVIAQDGLRYDIQLKGSGPTAFSRRGDGRAALGPVLREYIVSEAMAALGIPTTRALAAVVTGDLVQRETSLQGAMLTRVAASHLRVGTFQYFAARGDTEGLRLLTDYAIDRHYPELANAQEKYIAFLEHVIARQAKLVAHWMCVGFIHGVMNTDNTSISGETIDYGPCAFLESYDPHQVFSSIDAQGRYAYRNQPYAMQWNLARLAECLLPFLVKDGEDESHAVERATAALDQFMPQYEAGRVAGFREKLGLFSEREGDLELVEDLLGRMAENDADFTLTFRLLCDAARTENVDAEVGKMFARPGAYMEWAQRWRERLLVAPDTKEARYCAMRAVNPTFIPRNHLVQEVIDAAYLGNFDPFERLLAVVTTPFNDQGEHVAYTSPARPEQRITQTFCGT